MSNEFISETAHEVSGLCGRLLQATEEYNARVSDVEAAKSALNEISGDLADVTSELVYEATIEAKLQKSGPLFGVAASDSSGMKAARQQICKADGRCRDLAIEVGQMSRKLSSAEAERDQAKARMVSMRVAVEALSRTLEPMRQVK